jgi:hypothetical protein
MLTAYYDDTSGEMVGLVFTDKFKSEDGQCQADALGDLRGDIDRAYQEALSACLSEAPKRGQ